MSRSSPEAVAAARSHALEAFGHVRAHRDRFYIPFMAVWPSQPHDGICEATMPVRAHTLGPRGTVAPGALATLADIALAHSIMVHNEPRRRTPTVGLTLQIVREVPTERVHARAEVISMQGQLGISQCRLTDDRGDLLAFATGAFAVRQVPESSPWIPWSPDSSAEALLIAPVPPDALSTEEERLLKHVENSLRADDVDGPYASYLGIKWQTRGHNQASGSWTLGPHLWNRAFQVQGGATFGALSCAALACLPRDLPVRVVEQHTQFVRPGRGNVLRVIGRLLRRGQGLIFVEATIVDEEERAIASALVTMEGQSHPQAKSG